MHQIFFIFIFLIVFVLFGILCSYILLVNSHLFSKNKYKKKEQDSYNNNSTTLNGINNNELKRNSFMHLSNVHDTLTVLSLNESISKRTR